MVEESCCCGGVNMVLACSGASNTGQITNEVAKLLDTSDEAKFFCLAGIGGGLSGFIESARGADRVIVLDGCEVACAKACMDKAGLEVYEYIVVTDLGIKKKHEFNINDDETAMVVTVAREILGEHKNG